MPLYEYQCLKCGHRFERIQKFSDKPVKACPKCKKGKVEKMVSSPAFQFKGTGWYVTDYAAKGKSNDSSETNKEPTKEPTKEPAKETAKEAPKEKKTKPKSGKD